MSRAVEHAPKLRSVDWRGKKVENGGSVVKLLEDLEQIDAAGERCSEVRLFLAFPISPSSSHGKLAADRGSQRVPMLSESWLQSLT